MTKRVTKEIASNVIEHLACIEVIKKILQPPYKLLDEIPTNDKSPAYDGKILIYNNYLQRKEDLIGEVAVQLKGKTAFKNNTGNLKYSISKGDLVTYNNFAIGVLFFIGYINLKTCKTQVYYKEFMPIELSELVQELEKNGNESKQFEFKELPERAPEKGMSPMEFLCLRHMRNVEQQPKKMLELAKTKEFEKYNLSIPTWDGVSKIDIFKEKVLVSGMEDNVTYPIRLSKIEAVQRSRSHTFISNKGETISFTIDIKHTETDISVGFEKMMYFLQSRFDGSYRIEVEGMKNILAMRKIFKILQHFAETGTIPLGATESISSDVEQNDLALKAQTDIAECDNYIEVYKSLGIPLEYDTSNFTRNEVSDFLHFLEIAHGTSTLDEVAKLLKIESNKEERIQELLYHRLKLDISKDSYILIYIEREQNYYKIKGFNTLDSEKQVIVIDSKKRISPYVYFRDEIDIYSHAANSNPNKILDSIKNLEGDVSHDAHLDLGLMLLNYHIKENSPLSEEYAIVAKRIFIHLHEVGKINGDEEMKEHVYLNIIIAERILEEEKTKEEIEAQERFLENIIDISNKKNMQFAANVLLGEKRASKKLYEQLQPEEIELINDFPIENLYKKLIM